MKFSFLDACKECILFWNSKTDQILSDILIRGIIHNAKPTMQYFMTQWVLKAWCNFLFICQFPSVVSGRSKKEVTLY